MSVRAILTVAAMLSLITAAQATESNTINIEFANGSPEAVVLVSADAAEGYLVAEYKNGSTSMELVTIEGEVVAITGLRLTGAVKGIKYVTGWTGFIDDNPAHGYFSSLADTKSYEFGMPTRMLLDFVVLAVEFPANAIKMDNTLPNFAPMSIDEEDARQLATVIAPAAKSDEWSMPQDVSSLDPVRRNPSALAFPRLVSICGCNPSGGYPQTACAVWNPCSSACPSAPGNCGWYIFWVWFHLESSESAEWIEP